MEFDASFVKYLTRGCFPFTVTICEAFLRNVNAISVRGDNQK